MLSQQGVHHCLNLIQCDTSSFNMPGDQLEMDQQILIASVFIFSIKRLLSLLWFVFSGFTAAGIQPFFLSPAFIGLIIFIASFVGAFLLVGLATAEWASDILTSGVSRISEK